MCACDRWWFVVGVMILTVTRGGRHRWQWRWSGLFVATSVHLGHRQLQKLILTFGGGSVELVVLVVWLGVLLQVQLRCAVVRLRRHILS